MISKPLVSVVTPAYNCADYIRETIDSVLAQDYPSIEYIIVDDGSPDATSDVLKEYEGKVIYIRQDNAGEQKAVNRGLEMVRGTYFTIVNADDPLLPGCIPGLVEVMEQNPEVLCAYPDWQMIDGNGETIRHMKAPDYDFKRMVGHHWCQPSVGAMFRASVIESVGGRDDTFLYVGDFDYWLRVGAKGPMLHVPIEYATWRRQAGQKTGEVNPVKPAERLTLMEKFFSLPDLAPDILAIKAQAFSWACLVAAGLSGTMKERLHYIRCALRYYPLQVFTLDFWHALYNYVGYFIRRTSP